MTQHKSKNRDYIQQAFSQDKPRVLHSLRPENPFTALGAATSYLMQKPAFAKQQFGAWTRVLIGQINRKHFLLVSERRNKIVAFAGWAETTLEHAENWLHGRCDIPADCAEAGPMFVFNAWAADDIAAHRFLLNEMRPIFQSHEAMYYKRYYDDGRVRPVCLPVNAFVQRHVKRRMR